MQLVFITQFRENYAAHDWDGEGECPQGWKNKGGDTYVLTDLTIEEASNRDTLKDIVDTLVDHICYTNDYITEYMLDFNVVDDCADLLIIDDWERPVIIQRDGEQLKATSTIENDDYGYMNKAIERVVVTYTMGHGGKMENTNREVVYREVA